MHWVRDEKPIEHHLSGWHDNAYHHHETGKKKMLGGVSFEGGGAAGGSKRSTAQQAGVQTAQPSFSAMQAVGLGIGGADATKHGNSLRGADKKINGASGNRKDTVSIQRNHMNIETRKDAEQTTAAEAAVAAGTVITAQKAAQAASDGTENITTVTENIPVIEKRRFRFDYKKYFGKMRNGIWTFLKGMERKAGKESRQKPKKKEKSGTHAITKEEVYEIQANTAYLLDSYNKHGERSILGK